MSRILLTFAFLLVLPIPALADQEIPPDLKAGADFVWQLTQIKRTEDVIQHFRSPKIMAIVKANVDLDNDSKMRFNEIF